MPDEPNPKPLPIAAAPRESWLTRNKRLLAGIAVGGLLIIFMLGHSSNVKQQMQQQEDAAKRARDADAIKQRTEAQRNPQIIQQQRPSAQTYTGAAVAPQAPEKDKFDQAREDLKFKSLYSFNTVETKQQTPTPAPAAPAPEKPALAPTQAKPTANQLDFKPDQPLYLLPEGTMIEAVLDGQLDGGMEGPADCLVRTNVYYPRTRVLLLPQGAKFLGEAKRVEDFGQTRLAVVFHRILVPLPDPDAIYSIPLDPVDPGLDQQGTPGIGGKVNNHVFSSLAIAGAIGAIAGLAQAGNTFGYGAYDPMGQFRIGVSQSISQSSMQILNRFLNRLPTVKVPNGTRVNIRFNRDMRIPAVPNQEVADATN